MTTIPTAPPLIDLRQIALDLLELTGTTIVQLARLSGLHRPNLVSWLGGKPKVLAEQNQLKACEVLGWRYGRLRRDIVHRWVVGDDLALCKAMLLRFGVVDPEQLEIRHLEGMGSGIQFGVILRSSDDPAEPLIVLIRRALAIRQPTPIQAQTLGLGIDSPVPYVVESDEYRCWWADECKATNDFSTERYLKECGHQWIGDDFSHGESPLPLLSPDQQRVLDLMRKAAIDGVDSDKLCHWLIERIDAEIKSHEGSGRYG